MEAVGCCGGASSLPPHNVSNRRRVGQNDFKIKSSIVLYQVRFSILIFFLFFKEEITNDKEYFQKVALSSH